MRLAATLALLAACLLAGVPAVLLAGAPAGAQTTPQTEPTADPVETFTPAHLKLAQDVIDLTESAVIFDDILPRLADQTRDLFTRSNPALTSEIEETVLAIALDMAKQRVELSRTIQLVWARRFTEPELSELKVIFASPVGKKFVETTPVISALSIGAARQWETGLASTMVEQVRAQMREKGYTL